MTLLYMRPATLLGLGPIDSLAWYQLRFSPWGCCWRRHRPLAGAPPLPSTMAGRPTPPVANNNPCVSPPRLRHRLPTSTQRGPTPTSPPPSSLPGPLQRRAWSVYMRPPSPGSASAMRPMPWPARSPKRSSSSSSLPHPRSGPPLARPIPAWLTPRSSGTIRLILS